MECRDFGRQPVVALRLRPLSFDSPHLIGKMLLDPWDLRLNRDDNILQRRLRSAIRRNAGQYPGTAFLIHQAAGSIDGVHDDAPFGGRFAAAWRENHWTASQALRNHDK